MSVCLHRALHSKLLTRDFLKSLNIANTDTCILCNASKETIQHPYFQCPYSPYIWSLCRLKLGLAESPIGTLQDGAKLIKSSLKAKARTSVLAKLVLAAAVWHIWREENQRVFQLQEQNKLIVFRRLYKDVSVLLRTCNWKSDRIRIGSVICAFKLELLMYACISY